MFLSCSTLQSATYNVSKKIKTKRNKTVRIYESLQEKAGVLDCLWNHLLRVELAIIMVALCNRADHYIFALWFLSSFFFFYSPNLSGRRLDVYHIPHMVWP